MTDLAPINKSIVVSADAVAAFKHFTGRMGDWWPLASHCISAGKHDAPAKTCTMEPKVGGRVYETAPTGEEYDWGKVLVWEPGVRVAWSWHLSRPVEQATEIEVSFHDLGDVRTRVDLEHRNWARLGADAAETRANYDGGWDTVFADCFGASIGKAAW